MANHTQHLLHSWISQQHATEWVAGFVYATEGPCYRKAGAIMLFGGAGQQLGLLSGGCLESDLQRHARKVMQTGKQVYLSYDGSDEDDISFQLGIGCGGTVHIVLLPVDAQNNYLGFNQLHTYLAQGQSVIYTLSTETATAEMTPSSNPVSTHYEQQALTCYLSPVPHVVVVGGGIDARPVVSLAHELGWRVTVCDPRPANARAEHFPKANHVLRDIDDLTEFCQTHCVNAALIMSHSISMDAMAAKQIAPLALQYNALLGPKHRKQQVLTDAGLTEADFSTPLFGPAGFDIGGELPESIALSMLAQCHQQLYKPA